MKIKYISMKIEFVSIQRKMTLMKIELNMKKKVIMWIQWAKNIMKMKRLKIIKKEK